MLNQQDDQGYYLLLDHVQVFLILLVNHPDGHHNLMLFVQVAAELDVLALAKRVEKEERQVEEGR